MNTKITIVLFILFSLHAVAQVGTVFTTGGINYKITAATTVEVSTNPTTLAGAIVIPETISYDSANYSVTSIGISAFSSCVNLTSVIIPNSVTAIIDFAFRYCSGLKSVTIPNSVTSIGAYAFGDCTSLTAVIIPNSVVSFREGAFYMCASLTSVNIPASLTSIALYSFGACTELNEVIIPNSVKSIDEGAFFLCSKLSSITIPNSVTSIGNNAFIGCPFKSITIPNSVTSIGNYAFEWCTDLTLINIPSSITTIGDFAFSNCSGLTAVTVNGTTPIAINANVFENITLANVTLNVPAGTETAYKSANVWKEFKVETTLGTNSFLTNNALSFYPNPAQSQIHFSQEINNLEVFDIAGRKVKSFQNSSSNFDVSNLVKGIYLLKGKTTEGKSSSQKMVKQ